MHLTNYSINKHSDTFDSSEEVDRGSKRTLQFLNDWLSKHDYSVPELWAKIHVRLCCCFVVLLFCCVVVCCVVVAVAAVAIVSISSSGHYREDAPGDLPTPGPLLSSLSTRQKSRRAVPVL